MGPQSTNATAWYLVAVLWNRLRHTRDIWRFSNIPLIERWCLGILPLEAEWLLWPLSCGINWQYLVPTLVQVYPHNKHTCPEITMLCGDQATGRCSRRDFTWRKIKVREHPRRNSLMVQCLGLKAFTAKSMGSIPGPGTKILPALCGTPHPPKTDHPDARHVTEEAILEMYPPPP